MTITTKIKYNNGHIPNIKYVIYKDAMKIQNDNSNISKIQNDNGDSANMPTMIQ